MSRCRKSQLTKANNDDHRERWLYFVNVVSLAISLSPTISRLTNRGRKKLIFVNEWICQAMRFNEWMNTLGLQLHITVCCFFFCYQGAFAREREKIFTLLFFVYYIDHTYIIIVEWMNVEKTLVNRSSCSFASVLIWGHFAPILLLIFVDTCVFWNEPKKDENLPLMFAFFSFVQVSSPKLFLPHTHTHSDWDEDERKKVRHIHSFICSSLLSMS